MMTKHLKISLFILLFTIPLMIFGIYLNNNRIFSLYKGNHFFEKTRSHPNISSIVMRFSNGNTITINKKEDLWFIKEADDYFASLTRINSLVSLIRDTIIYRVDAIEKKKLPFKEKDGLILETIDNNGNIIERAVIAPKTIKNKHHYATINNNGFLYLINGNFNINSNVIDWLQMPILQINESDIKSIVSNDFEIYRDFNDGEFITAKTKQVVSYISSLINHLWFLTATDIKHSVNFNISEYKKIRTYEIYLFNGIVYKLNLYTNDNEYWINIRLDKNKLIEKKAIEWINENKSLFEGWFFKLSNEKGLLFSNFAI